MKKLLIVAILMLALVVTIAACSKDKPSTETGAVTTAGENATVAGPADETTAAPADETQAPAETTEAPADETTEAPADETAAPETTEEETTVDPADPVVVIDPAAMAAGQPINNAAVEVNDAGYASFTATDGDPWVTIAGNLGAMPEYLVISYRTNTTQSGEFFIGNGAGPEGGKSFGFNYNANGEWNLLVFHLPTVASYMTDNTVGHIRYDFYTGGPEDGAFLDVEYVAFFNTAEYAEAYHFAKHPAYVSPAEGGQTAVSFDTFKVNGQMYFEQDGEASAKLDAINNTVSFGIDEVVENVTLRGWIGFSQAIDSFGYYIDNPYAQTFGEFKAATEDVIFQLAGEHATRFEITVPVADLARGAHNIGFLAKLADGTVVLLRTEITIVTPTNYENLNVPQDQWVITGHREGIQNSSDGMVAAGGVESGALLHQGSIALGEIDLSKYSKVVVMWGCDNSQVTIDAYNANANNRIMLLNAEMSMVMSPAEETIIAGATYELMGWAVTAFEIDLTNVDYNGPVWLAIDALPGTFALFSSVEFIGAEIVDEEAPEAPENVVIDLSTIEGHLATNNFGYDCPIVEIGYDQVYLLGEFDLNQYAQIIIEYSYDGDTDLPDRTVEQCWADCGRTPIIGFTALNKCFGYANITNQDAIDYGVYTEIIRTPGNWAAATRTATIEVAENIGYSGPCYLSAYNPWGRTIAVASITLVPRA